MDGQGLRSPGAQPRLNAHRPSGILRHRSGGLRTPIYDRTVQQAGSKRVGAVRLPSAVLREARDSQDLDGAGPMIKESDGGRRSNVLCWISLQLGYRFAFFGQENRGPSPQTLESLHQRAEQGDARAGEPGYGALPGPRSSPAGRTRSISLIPQGRRSRRCSWVHWTCRHVRKW